MAICIGVHEEGEEDRAAEYLQLADWLSRIAAELCTTYPEAAEDMMSVAESYRRMAEKLTQGSDAQRANPADSWKALATSFEAQ